MWADGSALSVFITFANKKIVPTLENILKNIIFKRVQQENMIIYKFILIIRILTICIGKSSCLQ